MKIAHKLILGSLMLVLLSWGVGLYAVSVGRESLHKLITNDAATIASNAIEHIDDTLLEGVTDWHIYAAEPGFRAALVKSNTEFEARQDAQAYINEQDAQWRSQLQAGGSDTMRSIIASSHSDILRAYINKLATLRGYEIYGEAFVTNRFGVNVMQTGKTSDYRQDDEEWWQAAKRLGTFVGEVEFDQSAGVLGRDISIRVDDEEGNFLGVINAVLSMGAVRTMLEEVVHNEIEPKTGSHGSLVVLMDSTRRVLISIAEEHSNLTPGQAYTHSFGLPDEGRTTTFEIDDPEIGKALIACAFSGQEKGTPDLGWILSVEYPEEAILAPLTHLRNQIYLVATCITLVAIGMSTLVSLSYSKRLSKIRDHAVATGDGDFSSRLRMNHSDEIGQLSRSLDTMADKLERSVNDIEKSNWLKTGQTQLSEIIRGDRQPEALASNVIQFLAKYLDAQVGAVYLAEENQLRMVGSYAFTTRKHVANKIKFGDGVVGQAALEKQSILLTSVPEDYLAVSSGLGEATPANILVAPFLHNGRVQGVIELGSFRPFTDDAQYLMKNVGEIVAAAMNSVLSRQRIQDLLEETQRQSEVLQTQQEELRQSNEDLEEQAQTLKESEERLRVQQEELEVANQELEERTEAVEQQRDEARKSNDMLKATQQMLEDKAHDLEVTGRYKSEFLANMSHELRTPLNSLLILSKLLMDNEDDNLTDKQVEFAHTINGAGCDLLRLINEILDLSKIESGKMELVVEQVAIEEYICELAGQVKHVADENNLEFSVTIDPQTPAEISTDSQRLGQVIKNLLSNALKFTHEGSVRLKVAPAKAEHLPAGSNLQADDCIVIQVADTGIGIPKDKQKMIFEAFQQVDGTTDRKYGGTGLGLSISRELVRILGGQIVLESEEGKGSCFTLILPTAVASPSSPQASSETVVRNEVAEQANAHDDNNDTLDPVDTAPSSETAFIPDDRDSIAEGDHSILIIEDDESVAKLLGTLVRQKGFKCLLAGDGHSGLRLANEHLPTAALIDIGLPDLDGLTVIGRLKENLRTRHIPIHVISGDGNYTDVTSLGALGFLKKPITPATLDEAFRQIERLTSTKMRSMLIVEDNQAERNAIVELLSDENLTVTAVETGQQALDLLQTKTYDCMVLDLGLPDMTGMELLGKLRVSDVAREIPVVVFTGKELTAEEKLSLDSVAQRIIIKGEKASERLVDETTLFLHRVEKDLPERKRRMIRMIHDKAAILTGKTVLLVDDDVRNMFALGSMLEAKGLKLIMATNGRHALEMLAEHPQIDAVLMDIMMPEMDGYEAMKQIRQQERYASLPIIALTAKAMKKDRAKCIETGASDYLAKPVDADKLLSMLRVWLYPSHRSSNQTKKI